MKQYIGTKTLNAKPMTRGEYNALRGWTLPADENGADAGYLVEYLDGGAANHPDFSNYISWSPSDVFERAYLEIGDVSAMPPHQQRVVGEAAELLDKLTKLDAFRGSKFFATLPEAERGRLARQAELMRGYLEVLDARIAAF